MAYMFLLLPYPGKIIFEGGLVTSYHSPLKKKVVYIVGPRSCNLDNQFEVNNFSMCGKWCFLRYL